MEKGRKEKINSNQISPSDQTKKKYKLDLAGKLFSLVSRPRIPCVYRLEIEIKDKVDRKILKRAIKPLFQRFPYYQVLLKKGFFWRKWKETDQLPVIKKEVDFPCQNIPIKRKDKLPFRIIANNNKISLEVNHSITDGNGAINFIKALIAFYLQAMGEISSEKEVCNILNITEEPTKAEMEYSHQKYAKNKLPKIPKEKRAFHLPYEVASKGSFYTTRLVTDVNQILELSRERDVTLTEFLAAIYLDTIQEIYFSLPKKIQRKKKRPIRIMVPINLRQLCPSETMRNFTGYVTASIDIRLGKYSFDEILTRVHHLKNIQVNEKFVVRQLSTFNQLKRANNLVPWFLKTAVAKIGYRFLAENIFSGIMTNLGVVDFPPKLKKHVKKMTVYPMAHPYFKTGCGLITYNNRLFILFGRTYKEKTIEKKFIEKLEELDIDFQID
jgi:NRPS condensation-like uncharacterized protein